MWTLSRMASGDLAPHPRAVWRKTGLATVIFMRLFGLFPIAIALVLAFNLVAIALTHALGQTVPARVQQLHSRPFKGNMEYSVAYAFEVEGEQVQRTRKVYEKTWKSLHVGDSVAVKILTLLGRRHDELSISAWESTPWALASGFAVAAFMSSVLIAVAWVIPLRDAHLIRHGQICGGRIDDIQVNQKNNNQTVMFTYHPPGEAYRRGKTTGAICTRPAVGEVVTVFYSAARPSRAVAYECSYFETKKLG